MYKRYNIYVILIGGFTYWTSFNSCNQTMVQRYLSLPNDKQAQLYAFFCDLRIIVRMISFQVCWNIYFWCCIFYIFVLLCWTRSIHLLPRLRSSYFRAHCKKRSDTSFICSRIFRIFKRYARVIYCWCLWCRFKVKYVFHFKYLYVEKSFSVHYR